MSWDPCLAESLHSILYLILYQILKFAYQKQKQKNKTNQNKKVKKKKIFHYLSISKTTYWDINGSVFVAIITYIHISINRFRRNVMCCDAMCDSIKLINVLLRFIYSNKIIGG
jgi:hypothetical protein